MFATIEEKLIVGAIATVAVMVGVFGFIRHERSQGAAVCIQQQTSAEDTQSKKDSVSVNNSIADFHKELAGIPAAVGADVPMRVCITPSHVSQRPAPGSSKPATPAVVDSGSRVQTGIESGNDIGPAVQDITLSSMLCSADALQLWNLAIKEARQ